MTGASQLLLHLTQQLLLMTEIMAVVAIIMMIVIMVVVWWMCSINVTFLAMSADAMRQADTIKMHDTVDDTLLAQPRHTSVQSTGTRRREAVQADHSGDSTPTHIAAVAIGRPFPLTTSLATVPPLRKVAPYPTTSDHHLRLTLLPPSSPHHTTPHLPPPALHCTIPSSTNAPPLTQMPSSCLHSTPHLPTSPPTTSTNLISSASLLLSISTSTSFHFHFQSNPTPPHPTPSTCLPHASPTHPTLLNAIHSTNCITLSPLTRLLPPYTRTYLPQHPTHQSLHLHTRLPACLPAYLPTFLPSYTSLATVPPLRKVAPYPTTSDHHLRLTLLPTSSPHHTTPHLPPPALHCTIPSSTNAPPLTQMPSSCLHSTPHLPTSPPTTSTNLISSASLLLSISTSTSTSNSTFHPHPTPPHPIHMSAPCQPHTHPTLLSTQFIQPTASLSALSLDYFLHTHVHTYHNIPPTNPSTYIPACRPACLPTFLPSYLPTFLRSTSDMCDAMTGASQLLPPSDAAAAADDGDHGGRRNYHDDSDNGGGVVDVQH
ncbi:hypothetical protein TcWFU_004406 [Taenia crassiceps]|uniref:Uncharacterized protein n=1 Tax=Taenia crassiceps TaxID=6207 RepID=A0ABR4QDL9_9CEST